MNSPDFLAKGQLIRTRVWPANIHFDMHKKMRRSTSLKVFSWGLKLCSFYPSLSESIAYRLFFRVDPKARVVDCKGLDKLSPKISWIDLVDQNNSIRKVRYFEFGLAHSPAILLIHGWELNANKMSLFVESLVSSGFRVLIADLPAHGASEGSETDLRQINSVSKALLLNKKIAAVNDYESSDLIDCAAIIAHSFGGVCALELIKNGVSPKAVVLIATPSTFQSVFSKFSYLLGLSSSIQSSVKNKINNRFKKFSDDVWRAFCPSENIRSVSAPLLIVHDVEDTVVPVQESYMLFNAINKEEPAVNVEFLLSRGFGHNRLLFNKEVVEETTKFIRAANGF